MAGSTGKVTVLGTGGRAPGRTVSASHERRQDHIGGRRCIGHRRGRRYELRSQGRLGEHLLHWQRQPDADRRHDGLRIVLFHLAGPNTATLRPFTNGTLINLGGADAAGTLGLTDAELDTISAAKLKIGDANSGTITVSADITRPGTTDMQLNSGGDVVISGGRVDTFGGTLLLNPGTSPASVKPTNIGIDATASTVTLGGSLSIAIAGTTVDTQYTQFKVSGAVNLNGMNLVLSGAFVPSSGNVFTIVSATSVSGKFKGLANNATLVFNGRTLRINYTATAVTLTDITSGGSSTSSQSATVPATVIAGVTPASTSGVAANEGVNPLAGWSSLEGGGRANSVISALSSDIAAFSTGTLAIAEPFATLSSASSTLSRSDSVRRGWSGSQAARRAVQA